MKNPINKNVLLTIAAILFLASGNLFAQWTKGNKKVVKQERIVPEFTGIEVGGAFNVYLTIQQKTTLTIEADENLLENITTEVKGNVLKIDSKKIKNASKLNIYLSTPSIENIDAGGASTVIGENTLTAQLLEIEASGASHIELNVNVDEIITKASGASFIKLTGSANKHTVNASGASDVIAINLETKNTNANSSGASGISINATEAVESSSSGAGNITVAGNPEIITNTNEVYYSENETNVRSWKEGDTTIVKVGGITVEVIDGDSTKIAIGNSSLIVDECGNVKWKRNRKHKFNGHWAGFEMGVNGYVTSDFKLDVPQEFDFLTLKYEKSIDVNINFFEQNINLYNEKLGLVTGLGLRWNNYRFNDNTILVSDSSTIYGYRDYTHDWKKSKLVVNYLTLPLLIEYQSNRFSRSNSFHATAGVIIGWRYATHTKMLRFDNGRQKPKQWDHFHLRPFRYDATLRIGWGIINLYATYSMNTLFKADRGPELYPFAIGITFINF